MKNRRVFMKTLTAAALAAAQAGKAHAQQTAAPAAPSPSPKNPATLKKSTLISMLPRDRPYAERFAIGKEAGFEAIEIGTISAEAEAAEIKEASDKTGLKIHSVMNSDHWRFPLSSSDPEVVDEVRRRDGDVDQERQAVGCRDGAARARGRRCEDLVSRRLDAIAAHHPRAVAAGRARCQDHHRGRGGLEQVPPQPAGVRALRRRLRVAVGEGLLRRRQRRPLRLSAGLDPHARVPHRAPAPQGLPVRPARGHLRLEEHRRRGDRLAGDSPRAGRDRLLGLRDHGDSGRRSRLPEGRVGASRSFHRR